MNGRIFSHASLHHQLEAVLLNYRFTISGTRGKPTLEVVNSGNLARCSRSPDLPQNVCSCSLDLKRPQRTQRNRKCEAKNWTAVRASTAYSTFSPSHDLFSIPLFSNTGRGAMAGIEPGKGGPYLASCLNTKPVSFADYNKV